MEKNAHKNTYKRYWSECLSVLGLIDFADGENEIHLSHDERNCRVSIKEIFRDYCPMLLHVDGIDVYNSAVSQDAIAVLFGSRYILCVPQDAEDGYYHQCGTAFEGFSYREITDDKLPLWFKKKQYEEQWMDGRYLSFE